MIARRLLHTAVLTMLLAPALAAFAQTAAKPAAKRPPASDDQPAVSTSPGEVPAQPAASSRPAAAGPGGGTTIIGERESPIGLYITPWRNSIAEADIDRPARLLSVKLEALDRKVFARQVEYYEALTAAQKAKTGPAPSEPPPQP
jgi:hypothetical protein